MTEAGIRGMRAAGDDVVTIASAMTEDHWRASSAAEGWSVKDVFIHIGSLLEMLQAAVSGAESPPLGVEQLNNEVVAGRRHWSADQTVRFLRDQLGSALATFTAVQDEPVGSTLTPMLDLGNYPIHAIADMFSFDITTHLRYDVLGPRGPVPLQAPELDDVRLTPAVSWLIGGLSQMQPDLAAHVIAPISLRLTGPGDRHVIISTEAGTVTVTEHSREDAQATAAITSSTQDFLAWSTKRLPWSQLVRIDGDEQIAADFLDAVNLI